MHFEERMLSPAPRSIALQWQPFRRSRAPATLYVAKAQSYYWHNGLSMLR